MIEKELAETVKSYHETLVSKTLAAIEELQASGERITFYSVSEKAQIPRSTLYRCNDLKRFVAEARESRMAPDRTDGPRARIAELESALEAALRERDDLARLARVTGRIDYALIQLSKAS